MVIRYMGTKRHMASLVRSAIVDLRASGRAVDLFSGVGSVAESLAPHCSVVTNDALSFTGAMSRARFTGPDRQETASDVARALRPTYLRARRELMAEFADQVTAEEVAIKAGRGALLEYMAGAAHVGSSSASAAEAKRSARRLGLSRYKLASLYFGAGYFSMRQAIEIDALRYAIDKRATSADRDWLVSAWIASMSVLINAPGHTAQFLKPNSEAAMARLVKTWSRSIWDEFVKGLDSVSLVGSTTWRANNEVRIGDALEFLEVAPERLGAIYADPPYTKDQYSRYYHVYETLYRYDFPDSSGAGRNRSDRFSTGFSLKSSVKASFHDLCRQSSMHGLPLIISYPTDGLLTKTGVSVEAVANEYFGDVQTTSFGARHSTMGASQGHSKKDATENLYVCRP